MKDFRSLGILQVLCLLLAGAFSLQVGLWVSDRDPPVTVFKTFAMDAVEPGGTVVIRYEVERLRSCPVKLDRDIIDSKGIRVPLVDIDWGAAPGPLGRDRYGQPVSVPVGVKPGIAHYRVIAQYRCNMFQWVNPIIVRIETPFVVVEPGGQPFSAPSPILFCPSFTFQSDTARKDTPFAPQVSHRSRGSTSVSFVEGRTTSTIMRNGKPVVFPQPGHRNVIPSAS